MDHDGRVNVPLPAPAGRRTGPWRRALRMGLVAGLLLAALAACGGGPTRPRIGVSVATMQESVYGFMRDAMMERRAEDGVDVLWVSAEGSEAKQAADIEAFIAQDVDVIILHAVNTATAGALVRRAADAGIPVVAMDRLPGAAPVRLYVTADSRRVGQLQAEFLAERLGGRGKVAILAGEEGNSVARDITEANRAVLERHPGIAIVDVRAHRGWARDLAALTTEDLLAREPGIAGILANNSAMAMGALEAIERAGRKGRIAVVGADADRDACEALLEGTLAADVDKKPRSIGLASYLAAIQILRGEAIPSDAPIDNGGHPVPVRLTPVTLVDASTVRDEMRYRWGDL